MEKSGMQGRLLDTTEARQAFSSYYLADLSRYATALTGEEEAAKLLVKDAFLTAFARYKDSPCPRDCAPYLRSLVAMQHARCAEGHSMENEQRSRAAYRKSEREAARARLQCAALARQSARRVGTSSMRRASQTVQVQSDAAGRLTPCGGVSPAAKTAHAASAECAAQTVPTAQSSAAPAVHGARPEEAALAQPIAAQVFDPAYTAYWTPEQDGAESTPVKAEEPVSAPQASGAVQPMETNHAYIYDVERAKKIKSRPLAVINTCLLCAWLWLLAGYLGNAGVLPKWDLGYAWFNLNIFPLF